MSSSMDKLKKNVIVIQMQHPIRLSFRFHIKKTRILKELLISFKLIQKVEFSKKLNITSSNVNGNKAPRNAILYECIDKSFSTLTENTWICFDFKQ